MYLITVAKWCLFKASNDKINHKIKAKIYHQAPHDGPVLS